MKTKTHIIKISLSTALLIASAFICTLLAPTTSPAETAGGGPGYVPKVIWTREFPEAGAMNYSKLDVYPNGAIAVAGNTFPVASSKKEKKKSDHRAIVMKLNPEGRLVWKRTFQNEKSTFNISSVRALGDGGLLAAGGKQIKGGFLETNAWVTRLGPNGNMIWEKEFKGKKSSSFYAVDAAPGRGIVLAGQIDATLAFITAWLAKLNDEGEVVWQTKMRPGVRAWFSTVKILASGKLLTSILELPRRRTDYRSSLVCFDDKGKVVWKGAELKRCKLQAVNSFSVLQGERAAVCGSCMGHQDDPLWFMAVDQRGEILWEKRLGPPYAAGGASLAALPDGRLALAGSYRSESSEKKAFGWLHLCDKDGEVLWGTLLKGEAGGISSIVSTPDGYLLMSGYTKTGTKGKSKTTFWISKIKP